MQTNEIFLAVGEIVVGILAEELGVNGEKEAATSASTSASTSVSLYATYFDFTSELWWDVVAGPIVNSSDPAGLMKGMEMENALKCMCEESVGFLKRHVEGVLEGEGRELPESCKDLLSRDTFARLIGTFEQNAIGVRLRNPVYETLTSGGDFGEGVRDAVFPDMLPKLKEAMKRREEMEGGCEDEECDEGSEGEDSEEEEVSAERSDC